MMCEAIVELVIQLVAVDQLRHIEGFSPRRVDWLADKIRRENIWNKPVVLDDKYNLVMDGQHRMEASKVLRLKNVPVIRFSYASVEIWSLRPGKYQFDWRTVVDRALSGDIYPYKTVKHRFPVAIPRCGFSLEDLR